MATDPSGKRSVSLAMSQYLSVARPELLQRRQAVNLNYGDLFLAYQLVRTGAKMDDLAVKLKAGKTVWQAAEEQHADWKQIAGDAKKLAGKVDACAFVPLLCYLFARGNSSSVLDAEHGKIPEDQ